MYLEIIKLYLENTSLDDCSATKLKTNHQCGFLLFLLKKQGNCLSISQSPPSTFSPGWVLLLKL